MKAQTLIEYFNRLLPLDEKEIAFIEEVIKERRVKKDRSFFRKEKFANTIPRFLKVVSECIWRGSQGKGVIESIRKNGSFITRAVTRNPEKYNGQADEVVKGDLTDLASLTEAFKMHMVFL